VAGLCLLLFRGWGDACACSVGFALLVLGGAR